MSTIKKILSADIGGTSSRFALFSFGGQGLKKEQDCWVESKSVTSFPALIDKVHEGGLAWGQIDSAVLAVAGPVKRGVFCKPTQLSWSINLEGAEKRFGFRRSLLINDFVAQAYASRSPIAARAEKFLAGEVREDAAIAVVGAGTGFGKSILVPLPGGRFTALPSEGGHSNFSPETRREFEFFEFVSARMNIPYPTWDDIVSGKGLSSIHAFLTGHDLPPPEVAKTFDKGSETLEWAAKFYGRVSRNFVLECLGLGGLYVAGGIAAKNPALLTHRAFEQEFRNPRRHRELLAAVPGFLLSDQESGLWGAAFAAKQQLS